MNQIKVFGSELNSIIDYLLYNIGFYKYIFLCVHLNVKFYIISLLLKIQKQLKLFKIYFNFFSLILNRYVKKYYRRI